VWPGDTLTRRPMSVTEDNDERGGR
jgi:hypothetical protein